MPPVGPNTTPSGPKVTATPEPYALSSIGSSTSLAPCSTVELCSIPSSQANGRLGRSSSIELMIERTHTAARLGGVNGDSLLRRRDPEIVHERSTVPPSSHP